MGPYISLSVLVQSATHVVEIPNLGTLMIHHDPSIWEAVGPIRVQFRPGSRLPGLLPGPRKFESDMETQDFRMLFVMDTM